MDALQKWAEEETKLIKDPPRLDDRSLYTEMIREWILEHAGDEEDPSKATSPAQWQFALQAAKSPMAINKERQEMKLPALPQALTAGKDLQTTIPRSFAYQTRRHWIDAGLPLRDEAQDMINKVPDVAWPPLVGNPAAYKGRRLFRHDPAAAVKAFFDGKTCTVNKTREPQLTHPIDEQGTHGLRPGRGAEAPHRRKPVLSRLPLDLAEADGSVYVNEWKYMIRFYGQLPEHTCVVDFRSGKKHCGHPEKETSLTSPPTDRRRGAKPP